MRPGLRSLGEASCLCYPHGAWKSVFFRGCNHPHSSCTRNHSGSLRVQNKGLGMPGVTLRSAVAAGQAQIRVLVACSGGRMLLACGVGSGRCRPSIFAVMALCWPRSLEHTMPSGSRLGPARPWPVGADMCYAAYSPSPAVRDKRRVETRWEIQLAQVRQQRAWLPQPHLFG
jgi:hypothetical protein